MLLPPGQHVVWAAGGLLRRDILQVQPELTMFIPILSVCGVLLLLVLGLVIFIATRPAEFTVQRSTTLAAPPAVPFALVNDFHQWGGWSPWEKMDPDLKRTYAGAAAGPGAIYSWSGNKKVGEGRMTILETRPGERIRIKLEFLKPFTATNTAVFEFQPAGGGTQITWSMHGTRSFVFKAFGLFMDMDKMIGPDFEKGLAGIKALSEKSA
jgi:hypothetical protein